MSEIDREFLQWYIDARARIIAADDPTPTTNPKDQDYWPQDSLHDAARQVVGDIKGLVPNARRTLREAAERADATPVGRAASDAAVGRALRSGS